MTNQKQDSAYKTFGKLNLNNQILEALDKIGYQKPSPIQEEIIPSIMEKKDVLGIAQTGTGKTAAFTLPILSLIDAEEKKAPQALILAPTRELAIQVADSCKKYSMSIEGLHVLPIYGGQPYRTQLNSLKKGVQIVVGTPGRVMDHIRRGTLNLSEIKHLVLDEADEMLNMGFVEDVEWILQQAPENIQTALFSATMPRKIKNIVDKYLKNPVKVEIKTKTKTASTIKQRFLNTREYCKIDILDRVLQAQNHDAAIIFAKTKSATEEISDSLRTKGYKVAHINGDVAQEERERTIKKLKDSKIDILVATDVAARGLDVKRISLVINFDLPQDNESYVHRIGRTGRANTEGDAIVFVHPNEKFIINKIERSTKQKIEEMPIPSADELNKKRVAKFKQQITDTIENGNIKFFSNIIDEYIAESNFDKGDVAAALAKLLQGESPLFIAKPKISLKNKPSVRNSRDKDKRRSRRSNKSFDSNPRSRDTRSKDKNKKFEKPRKRRK